MRAIPAKVIGLMGMDETAFPRQNRSMSLNLMKGAEGVDYCPTTVDYDRYLFLEALLSARESLLLSYVGDSPSAGSDLEPSLVIQDLLETLDSGYRLGDQKPSEVMITHHPYQSFDPSYFVKQRTFKLSTGLPTFLGQRRVPGACFLY